MEVLKKEEKRKNMEVDGISIEFFIPNLSIKATTKKLSTTQTGQEEITNRAIIFLETQTGL